jgi:hypothetical protein
LSQIVQRDYFPSLTSGDVVEPFPQSLTAFHRNATSTEAFALEQMQQETSKKSEYRHAVIYDRKRKFPNKDEVANLDAPVAATETSYPVAELRNALYFPMSMTDAAMSQTPEYLLHDSTTLLNEQMLPPPSRPTSTALSIVPAATRFPSTATPAKKYPKNIYQSNSFHWEGSTKAGDDDQSSVFTDLDATTVDSYSVRAELQKAARSSRMVPALVPTAATASLEMTEDVNSNTMYHIPLESSRDVTAKGILQKQGQQRSLHQQKHSRDHDQRVSSKTRPSPRSSSSLRFALRATYKKPSAKVSKSPLQLLSRKNAPRTNRHTNLKESEK